MFVECVCLHQSVNEHECSFVSVQECNSANACFCVYVSLSVSIFPTSDLISVTQRMK